MRGALCILLMAAAALAQEPRPRPDDAFVAGYVTAILERELRVPLALVRVKEGVVTVAAERVGGIDHERLRALLAEVPGVVRIEIDGATPAATDAPRPAPLVTAPGGGAEVAVRPSTTSFLLETPLLFEPLHADPRWPHFAAAYHSYHGNDDLENVATVSFGESFSLYRRPFSERDDWELGLQAGVFAIFDLDAPSKDLVNADYFVGPVFALRQGDFSMLARVYHQSSHLGDEYLLHTSVGRVNLSYEAADVVLSWDVLDPVRVYGGFGYVLNTSGVDLDPWMLQGGAEAMGPSLGHGWRPVAAVDLQSREHHDFEGDVSVRFGFQVENAAAPSLRLQLLLEYYRGRSPNGQFLNQDIEFYGFGVHFYF